MAVGCNMWKTIRVKEKSKFWKTPKKNLYLCSPKKQAISIMQNNAQTLDFQPFKICIGGG